ncbi:MAG: cadherin-like beta sandwich domain-containing protein [Clostridium sp.]|uniref:cadherin-like beta sandwich domain-containing protein n=1 Tax=Clostridium sp. TaxID=1506 RepID=UPI0025BE2104|nr:cadherin-like beta sandwich domain-containing protein [Clostridium sp.]MCE5222199.1 cadherin-like beta sandwich domain-containing protein [Clostridium sp.]
MKTKFTFKKIISYLLMFTVVLGLMQSVSIHIAKADTTTVSADRTFIDQVTIKADGTDTLTVDKRSDGVFICDAINMGTTSFTIEGNTSNNYTVTNVVSTGKMTKNVGIGSTVGSSKYTFSNITDYNEFNFVITVKDANNVVSTYTVLMKFDTETLFTFDNMRITYTDTQNSTSSSTILYNEKGTDGYYRNSADDNITKAKIELISGSFVINTGVRINGSSNNEVNLVGGDNIITITITRNNTSRQYNLIITKKGQPLLQSLVPSAGTLTPAFDTNSFDYTLNVPTTQTTIAFTPTSVDNSSTIKVGKNVVKSGKKSSEITLSEGTNKIPVVVTTKEGETSTYMVNVVRAEKFRSANLSGLTLSSGTLNPAFNKEIYEYTAIVDNTVSSITVTAKAEDSAATIKINDKKIPSGAASGYINLNEGGNLVSVTVTDTNGNTNTYTINVTRKYSKNNVNLSSLSITDGTISPKFDPETYLYSVKIARNIEKVRVTFASQNDKAKIKINGKEYTTGQQSDYINLDIGANLVIVEVTAEDGKTTTTYKLSMIRGDIEGTNQWVLVAGNWTFYNGAGIQIKNQWVKYDNQWYFLDLNGYMQCGWMLESGNWYYLNKDGIMQTGWLYDKGYWYYLQGDGSMRINTWATYDGKWYFFNDLGELQTGWTLYLGRWYYMDEHGAMQKGWITYDKNQYYLNDDGTMKNGWLYSGKSWSYLDSYGKMVRGWQTIDGKNYYFDANGVMKTGLMFLDGKWINLNNA